MYRKPARLFFCSFLFSIFLLPAIAQNTVGVIQIEEEQLQDGYTFFSPFSGTKAYLVDNCGELVNQWDRGTRPGLSAYFLENGLMLRTYKLDPLGPFTSASNAGGLELVDWDNNTLWQYEINSPTQLSHHDAVYMPNGNILVLTWELVYETELIELGRDPDEIAPEGFMWSEHILELEPLGQNEANIIWEWEIRDHYIQDFDATKLNYGVVSEHPELFNINLPELNSSNSNASRDWNHFNGIDYNPDLDQILISVRNSDEIWILDHSTTTAEAASHSGGLYGKGGDILYRWGNAAAYNRAPLSQQKLFGQHGAQWIGEGLEDAGKIILFNNGNGRPGTDYSTGETLDPPQDANGGYPVPVTDPFGPEETQIIYGDQPSDWLYSPYLSNAQRLPSGNTLMNYGSLGTLLEISPEKEVLWEYVIPLVGDVPVPQGQTANNNWSFRAYRYPPDYSGLTGLDLSPNGTIEPGESQIDCVLTNAQEPSIDHSKVSSSIGLVYDRAAQALVVENPEFKQLSISLFDLWGRKVFFATEGAAQQLTFFLPVLLDGIYIAHVSTREGDRVVEKLFLN
jgi:hypothetical protein